MRNKTPIDTSAGRRHARRRITGSRVLCISRGRLLVVQHVDPQTDEQYWVLPGGGREPGETFEQAAIREVREETGIDARIVRRLRVPRRVLDATYALFLAEPLEHVTPVPLVDLGQEEYLRGAAWHPISDDAPLDGLNPSFWGYLAPLVRRLLRPGRTSP